MANIKTKDYIQDCLIESFKEKIDFTDELRRLLEDVYRQGYDAGCMSCKSKSDTDVLKVIDRLDTYSIKALSKLFHCNANGDKRLRYSYILQNFTVHEINIILNNYDRHVDDENLERVANDIDKYIQCLYSGYDIKGVIQKLSEKYNDKED